MKANLVVLYYAHFAVLTQSTLRKCVIAQIVNSRRIIEQCLNQNLKKFKFYNKRNVLYNSDDNGLVLFEKGLRNLLNTIILCSNNVLD